MGISVSVLTLVGVFTLSLFLSVLNYSLWRVQRDDLTPLWLAALLSTSAVVALCRLLQYAPLDEQLYIVLPRVLLTAVYILAWLGYELANTFMGRRPPHWERTLVVLSVAVAIWLLWPSNLILTKQVVIRTVLFGGSFYGVMTGFLYLPVGILISMLVAVSAIRLVQSPNSHKWETRLMVMGFVLVILFSLIDVVATSRNLAWIRFSDFSYLPLAIFFSYIQVQRFGQLYRDLDIRVQERTTELRQVNQALRAEIVERKRAEDEIRRKADEMTALYQITHDLVIGQDLNRLLYTIVERAVELLEASGGGLYLCEPEQRQVRCVVSYNTQHDYSGVILKYGEGAAGEVAETGEPLIIDDYRTWQGRAAIYEQEQPFISLLSVPMHWQEDVIGVIHVLDYSVTRAFTQDDQKVLTLFANQAAVAIENSRLFETEMRRSKEAEAIAEIGRDISATLHLDAVLERIATHARDLLGAETSAVYLSEPATRTLRAIAASGPDAEQIKDDPLQVGEGILGNIAMQEYGEIVNNTTFDARAITVKGTEINPNEHIMGVPVLSGNRLTGLIAVWRTGAGLEFKSTELDLLSRLAGQVAVAIENARLFEETQKRLREMVGMAQVGEALSHSAELEPLLENILQAAINAIPAAKRGSFLLADEKKYLQIRAIWGYNDPQVRMSSFPPDSGYASRSFWERRAIVISDVRADPRIRYDGNIPEMLMGGSAIAAPLIVKDHPIGVIAIDTPVREDAFNESDLQILTAISASAALAIENARLFENTRRRLLEIEAVHTVSTALRSAQTLDMALPIILDQLMNLLRANGASLELVDPLNGEIVTELAHGAWAHVTGLRTPGGEGVSGQIIATGQPYVSTDVVADGKAVWPDLFGGLHAVACVPVISQHQPIGALWIGRHVPIHEDEVSLLAAIGEMVGNAIHRMKLHEQTERLLHDLQISNLELSKAYDITLEGWAKALELRDKETEGHSRRLTDLTLRLALLMGISEPELIHIRRGVLLHDIGKMGISDQLLRKTTPLTEDDWIEMRKHPKYAYDLLHPITYLHLALDIPYCHHEKWDGTGYPRGLKGDQIPLAARIFAVVDVYDALLFDRPYRKAWPPQKVLDYLHEQSGKHFDPQVVGEFIRLLKDQ